MSETKVACINNGPLRVSGSFSIVDAQGAVFDLAGREAVSLCRCGASANKPFCDGAHRGVGFQSDVVARPLPPPAQKG